ncbi:tyrosine-protein phosphatase non-receptor type 23 isoform X2 [Nematostella vectensis]|uniref:tyrosine-protein phosphatase non-receptor type 23 isoform X2 n=1 Tax=Nematostella vectensis TaxID=45351 RepID=UPI00207725DB|nr:tyrosine-protein phosphatase non-receptor type 23 isoform X2 [Nematostella vectensis]
MEGCPRSSMLSIDFKESLATDLSTPLKKYISEHYQEDPDSYKQECSQIEQLRAACLHPSKDHSGCSILRRYFAQLQFLQSRFPMAEGGAIPVQFTWTDLYSEEPISLADVRFEQASILHNLGALHSLLGKNEDRTGEEGMKVACTHFQAAAGVFQYLKNTTMVPLSALKLPWISEDHFATEAFFDMASCLLQLYISVMLGQAQECLLEKSILDGRKDSLIARISVQVHDFYQEGLAFLESLGSSYMGSKKAKIWTKALKIKACHYMAVAYIFMSNNANENQKFGEKVTYLKAASKKLGEAQKLVKGQPERTQEILQFMVDVVSNKLEGAVKDNDFIYHEVVPELSALPEIKGASLVKPIPFQPNDPSLAGPDIFKRLIPMEAHTDASLYSEEKAKLLRRYGASIDAKNKALGQALANLHIDDLLQPDQIDTLPPMLKEKNEILRCDPEELVKIDQNIKDLQKLSDNIESTLKSVSYLIDEDEEKENEAKALFGPMQAPKEREEIKSELDKNLKTHAIACKTNNELMRAYKSHLANLELLAGPQEVLLASLPSPNIIDSPVDDGAVQRLRDLIAKVDHMKSQRKQLEEDLRREINADDITGLLVTREEGSKQAFFDEQLKKHSHTCSLIQANLDAQDRILSALTEANAKYAPMRQAVKENSQKREDVAKGLILSYNVLCELKGKVSRGLQFFQNLEAKVDKLEEKCKNFFDQHGQELQRKLESKKKATESSRPPSRPTASKPEYLTRPPEINPQGPVPTMWPVSVPPGLTGAMPPRPSLPNVPQGLPQQPGNPGILPGSLPNTTAISQVQPHVPSLPSSLPTTAPARSLYSSSQAVPFQVPGPYFQASIPSPGPPTGYHGQPPSSNISASIPGTLPSHVPSYQGQQHIPADQSIHSAPRMSNTIPIRPGSQIVEPSQPNNQNFPLTPPHQVGLSQQQGPHYNMPPQQQLRPAGPRLDGPRAGTPVGHQSQPMSQQFNPQLYPYHAPPPSQVLGRPQNPDQQVRQPGPPILQAQPPFSQGPRSVQPFPPQNVQSSSGQLVMQPQSWQHPNSLGYAQPQRFQPPLGPPQPRPPQSPLRPELPNQVQSNQRPMSPQQFPQRPQFPPSGTSPQVSQPQFTMPPPLQPTTITAVPQPRHLQTEGSGQQQGTPDSRHAPNVIPPQQSTQPGQQSNFFSSQQQPKQFQPQFPTSQHSQQPFQSGQAPQQFQQPFPTEHQPQQPFRPGQQCQYSTRSDQQTQSTFQPGHKHQQPFRPEQPFQPGLQPRQPFRPDQQSQQAFRPEQQPQLPFQPGQSPQQPFLPDQQSQKPFRPEQQPQQPFRPGQQPQQPFRSVQPPQQPFRADQQTQQPFQSGQQPHQPFRSVQQPQQPFRADQQNRQPFQSGQQPQQAFRPGQQPQQPSRPGQQPQQPFRPEQQPQQPFRSVQPPQQPFRADQQTQQPFQPGQQPQQAFRPGQQPQQPFRPEQQSQQSSRPGQQCQPQFLPDQQPLQPYRAIQLTQRQQQQESDQQQQERMLKPLVAPTSQLSRVEQYTPTAMNPLQSRPTRADSHSVRQPIDPPQVTYQDYLGGSINRSLTCTPAVTTTSQDSRPPSYPETGARVSHSNEQVWPLAPTAPAQQDPRSSPVSDYQTSYSVNLAQAQLNQYNYANAQQQQQQQFQEFQREMMMQQQSMMFQLQEMLRVQQTVQHAHEVTDHGQVSLLMQQILEQQKKLADLEQKIKEKTHEEATPEERQESIGSTNSMLITGETTEGKKMENQAVPRSDTNSQEETPSNTIGIPSDPESNPQSIPTEGPSKPVVPNYDSSLFSEFAARLVPHESETAYSADKKHSYDDLEDCLCEDHGVEDDGVGEHPIDPTGSDDGDDSYLKGNDDNADNASKEDLSPKIDTPTASNDEKADEKETLDVNNETKEPQNQPQHVEYHYEPGSLPSPGYHSSEPPPTPPADYPTDEDGDKPPLHRQWGHYYYTQMSRIGQEANNKYISKEEVLQGLVSAIEGFEGVVDSLADRKPGTIMDGFTAEWKELERLQEYDSSKLTTHAAKMNNTKNRYRDIHPWDHTRVLLTTKENGDYINASYIKETTPMSPPFIATQGPIASTLADFWLMVWEQQSPVIVMLTKEVEGNKLKCHQYWPIDEGHTNLFGPMRVSLKSLTSSPGWIRRVMHIQHNDSQETLLVTMLQFILWPDYGVPKSPEDLIAFMGEVETCYTETEGEGGKPIILHCSAGVGRTGTFCVIFSAIREFTAHNGIINIPRMVRTLRQQRKYMVQKKEQYEMCYRTIAFFARQYVDFERISEFPKESLSTTATSTKPTSAFSEEVVEVPTTHREQEVARPGPPGRSQAPSEQAVSIDLKSKKIRFIGELQSDDSLDDDASSDKKGPDLPDSCSTETISHRYCEGTLDTDAALPRTSSLDPQPPKTDESERREPSATTPRQNAQTETKGGLNEGLVPSHYTPQASVSEDSSQPTVASTAIMSTSPVTGVISSPLSTSEKPRLDDKARAESSQAELPDVSVPSSKCDESQDIVQAPEEPPSQVAGALQVEKKTPLNTTENQKEIESPSCDEISSEAISQLSRTSHQAVATQAEPSSADSITSPDCLQQEQPSTSDRSTLPEPLSTIKNTSPESLPAGESLSTSDRSSSTLPEPSTTDATTSHHESLPAAEPLSTSDRSSSILPEPSTTDATTSHHESLPAAEPLSTTDRSSTLPEPSTTDVTTSHESLPAAEPFSTSDRSSTLPEPSTTDATTRHESLTAGEPLSTSGVSYKPLSEPSSLESLPADEPPSISRHLSNTSSEPISGDTPIPTEPAPADEPISTPDYSSPKPVEQCDQAVLGANIELKVPSEAVMTSSDLNVDSRESENNSSQKSAMADDGR